MSLPEQKDTIKMAPTAEATFNWEDPFLLSAQLREEERMVSDSAKEFCRQELLPVVKNAHRNETFDRKIMELFGNNLL